MAKAHQTPLDPAIRRVRLDSLRIFEISEAELEALERGSPESIFLNLALTILSVAISFSITLATTTISSDRKFIVFVIVTCISYLAGVTFGIFWLISRRSLKSVSAKIRSRILPEGIQEVGNAE
jgi:hypothetical protein